VTISVVNMRKAMVDNVSERVSKIDYVALAYGSVISDYASLFEDEIISVYDKSVNSELVTSFEVSYNLLYVVRIIDTAGNDSYNSIRINNIDKDAPVIITNTYGDGSDRIYVDTSSGNNIRVEVSDDDLVYKYSNETLKIYFGSDSLRDASTGFNNYLGLRICFDDSECVYNTYSVSYTLVSDNLVNNAISINAPYNFSGTIRYYLVDAAGNTSVIHSFEVMYQSEVSEVNVSLKDANDNVLVDSKEYNKVIVSFGGEEAVDIIAAGGIKYALVASNVNLYNEFANREGSVDAFLNEYNFVSASGASNEISISNVDSSYYVWVYIKDLLNNYKLMKVENLVNIDTISPLFSELSLSINKVDATNYDLVVGNLINEYKLYIDVNNDGEYEEVMLINNTYSFTVSGVSNVGIKLVDEANNVTSDSFSLSGSGDVYARVYQLDNTRKANVVIYNLGNKTVTSFGYILTSMNSNEVFDNDSILDDQIEDCSQYDGVACRSYSYTLSSKNVYQINLSSDKKVVFYIYVDGNLIFDYNGNLLQTNIFVDSSAPDVSFSSSNPTIVSTKNGSYIFDLSISDDNISSNDYKYLFTNNSNINKSTFDSYYNACVNSSSCARGMFTDSIEINSNISQFNNLISGNYYLYAYVFDDYNNISLTRSDLIYVDNDAVVIGYSVKNAGGVYDSYVNINGEVFVGSAVKLRFMDNKAIKYFEIYNENNKVVCYVDTTNGDENCDKVSGGEIGFVKEGSIVYYYLDNGNYTVVAYDGVLNSVEIKINVDNGNPVIKLYKNVSGIYEEQNSSAKVFNSLNGLYISVNDNNFNYLTIDLENTKTNEIIRTAARYSYNSDIGSCLSDINVCEFGKELVSMLSDNTLSYNKIIINAYDKAGRSASMIINYDDGVPSIWTMSVGESVYIDGVLYTLEENMTINIEIGVNKGLTLDKLMNKIILDVDGMSYSEVKNNELFVISVYKDSVVFTGDVLNNIGSYRLDIDYRDEASNVAQTKTIRINVLDNVKPELVVIDSSVNVEVNTNVELFGIKASDNYGLEGNVKEKNIALSSASCVLSTIDGVVNCDENVIKVADNVYKFAISGVYVFDYTVSDLSGNTSTISQIINVSDNVGPNMSSSDLLTRVVEFGDRNIDGSINIETLSFIYPNSYDNGDASNKDVEYLGLFSLNNMGEKYRVSDDTYIISDNGEILVYKFTKVGTYYLRFSSSDISNNISVFEYEVKVEDNIAPVISGLVDGLIVNVGLDETFDVEENIISYYNVRAIDNYDQNVNIYYEFSADSNHTYKVVLKAMDSSNNMVNINVYVDIVDDEAPIVGELVLDEITSQRVLPFKIVGGEDNSNNYWHEYSVQNGEWVRYTSESALEFGNGLNQSISVCIRAVDFAGNKSSSLCKNIIVDTKAPVISGVNDGDVINSEVTISVNDDRLASVEVLHNNQVVNIENNTSFKLNELGSYTISAIDSLGNEIILNFIINIDVYMNVVNDINSSEQIVTSVEFDKRILVKADVSYDNNGNSNISVNLNNISANSNDMIYILGVVPNSSNTFVMFSLSGSNLSDYDNEIVLIGDGNSFKDNINNEDCFLKFNDSYYAYLIIKEDSNVAPEISNEDIENNGSSKTLGTVLIVASSVVIALVGYQIIRFRKRVRAA